jgi:hypothetical protein
MVKKGGGMFDFLKTPEQLAKEKAEAGVQAPAPAPSPAPASNPSQASYNPFAGLFGSSTPAKPEPVTGQQAGGRKRKSGKKSKKTKSSKRKTAHKKK